MNVIELKTAIYEFLATKSSRVFDEQAPAKVAYPYVVFSLDTSMTDENQEREDFDLIVDVYDNNQFNSTDLDTLVGQIDGDGAMTSASGLHRRHHYEEGVLRADFYRVTRTVNYEPDERVRHVELGYTVMCYLE